MVIVFDVDGTLIGGEEQDWPSFDAALQSELGFSPGQDFWAGLDDVTARNIVMRSAEAVGIQVPEDGSLEEKVKRGYLNNLRKAAPFKRSVFLPKPGAVEVLQLLKQTPIFDVAIATGDFKETSQFKLGSAGIDIKGIPFASSSDERFRKDIIAEAVKRAGGMIEEAVYIGDGPWDLKACEQLDIPFIGTGRKPERLEAAGADWIVQDLSPATLLPILNKVV